MCTSGGKVLYLFREKEKKRGTSMITSFVLCDIAYLFMLKRLGLDVRYFSNFFLILLR